MREVGEVVPLLSVPAKKALGEQPLLGCEHGRSGRLNEQRLGRAG